MMGLRDSGPRPESLIATEDLSRIFGSGETAVTAVNAVNLEVPQGELMAVVGRSGSGKTTLLNLLSGLDRPTNGTLRLRGENLPELSEEALTRFRAENIGIVFQQFHLMAHLTALENVGLPLEMARSRTAQSQAQKA